MKKFFNMKELKTEDILQQLSEIGYRQTRSRRAVIRVLEEAKGWLRPEEIQARGKRYCPSLGLVTVYRTLALLSRLDYIGRVHFEDGCHGYARTELAHGHHLVCRNCHQVVEFPGWEDISALIEPIEQETGFLVEDHVLGLLGLCPVCQEEG
jgi:Fur family ferric uptake transcriptional regulator